ncbi:MAG: hypothetical protein KL863_09315 [Rhizobium sp.]|nr:hypothetical protein [Rhizobium sp.]
MAMPDIGIGADLNGSIAFSTESEWNMRVDFTPLAKGSARIIKAIAPDRGLHADFGSGLWEGSRIGIPYMVVGEDEELTDFLCTLWPSESDEGPFPIPADAPIEGGGDRHVIVIQLDSTRPNGLGTLYEIYDADWDSQHQRWTGQAAVFDLQGGDHQRPLGWTSADAAGLPIFAGLARYDEATAAVAVDGTLGHALRFTLSQALTAMKAIGAASHWADTIDGPAAFGMHVRLRADFDIADDVSAETRVIINTLKQYGMILADNGSDWYISGAPDERWDNEALRALKDIRGRDFEVVDNDRIGVVYVGRATADTIDGNERDNRIFGEKGSDSLDGGAGRDRLAGWRGDDILTGGADRDVFAFNAASFGKQQTRALGHDTIADFELAGADHDILLIDRRLGTKNYDSMMQTADQNGADLTIELNDRTTITLTGIDQTDLSASHVVFV